MPVTPRTGILYSDGTGAATTTAPSSALTLHCQGYGRTLVTFAAPAPGTSYTYAITNRIPQSPDGAASAWSTTNLDTATVSGTNDTVVEIIGDYGELRITVSSPSGSPSYLIHYHLTD